MNSGVFLLLTDQDELLPEIIYARGSSLKVKVYNLAKMNFTASDTEIQLYAYTDEGLLVFETEDVNADDILDTISAIRWYTRYIGRPDTEILPEDPRLGHEIAV